MICIKSDVDEQNSSVKQGNLTQKSQRVSSRCSTAEKPRMLHTGLCGTQLLHLVQNRAEDCVGIFITLQKHTSAIIFQRHAQSGQSVSTDKNVRPSGTENQNRYADVAKHYTSRSQAIRVITEHWMEENTYCPCCGNPVIHRFPNNRPVADFYCPKCNEEFELRSKAGGIGQVIADGAYGTMIARIQVTNNPNFFFLNYDKNNLRVRYLVVVPKHFFTAGIIEKRRRLKDSAQRAGWAGCNILISKIPDNHHIKDKMRQQLQILRDHGLIGFVKREHYKKLF